MLWERAKNGMIIFFVVLNLLLAWFIYREENRYTLTPERTQAIYEVLRANNINWYIRLNRNYKPMKALQISGYAYDMASLLPVFFEDATKAEKFLNGEKEVYLDGSAELILSNGYLSFTKYWEPSGGALPDAKEAEALCDTFIRDNFPNYTVDGVQETAFGIRISYRELYQEYIVYGNFIEFLVTYDGIRQIDMQFGKVSGFTGPERDIAAPDEALLTFTQWMRSLNSNIPVTINQMDMVYYQEEFSSQDYTPLMATPYYRFFIQDRDMPFMVNAYNNTVLN
jgi:hypothetical protein